MKTTNQYLDAVKKKHKLPSDYALAAFLGVRKQTISTYRNTDGAMDNFVALRVARALEIEPLEVIAAASAQRTHSAEEKREWESVIKGIAVCLVMSLLGLSVPTPSEAGVSKSVYYVKSRRRRRDALNTPSFYPI